MLSKNACSSSWPIAQADFHLDYMLRCLTLGTKPVHRATGQCGDLCHIQSNLPLLDIRKASPTQEDILTLLSSQALSVTLC